MTFQQITVYVKKGSKGARENLKNIVRLQNVYLQSTYIHINAYKAQDLTYRNKDV